MSANSAAPVPTESNGTPAMAWKSFSPVLPPKPMSSRKKASISAKVIAWVMMDR